MCRVVLSYVVYVVCVVRQLLIWLWFVLECGQSGVSNATVWSGCFGFVLYVLFISAQLCVSVVLGMHRMICVFSGSVVASCVGVWILGGVVVMVLLVGCLLDSICFGCCVCVCWCCFDCSCCGDVWWVWQGGEAMFSPWCEAVFPFVYEGPFGQNIVVNPVVLWVIVFGVSFQFPGFKGRISFCVIRFKFEGGHDGKRMRC